jgi:hypothetical protein
MYLLEMTLAIDQMLLNIFRVVKYEMPTENKFLGKFSVHDLRHDADLRRVSGTQDTA